MNLKEKYGLSKGGAVVLFIGFVLACFTLVCSIIGLFVTHENPTKALVNIIGTIIALAAAIFYAVYGYKVPHGNLLKYTMWLFCLVLIVTKSLMIVDNASKCIWSTISSYLIVALIAFMSGRLNKVKQNTYLATIILVLLAITAVFTIYFHGQRTFLRVVSGLGNVVTWYCINSAYLLRYRLHKEAGLIDKQDSKE